MKILAADTSTTTGTLALTEDGRVMAEWTVHSTQTHNRRLLRMTDRVLQEVQWSLGDIDAFAVTLGPGSFTGLRIGLSTMKTLAWALEKPFIGIPSLDALAAPLGFAALPICTVLDARKQEVYYALYQPDGKGAVHRQTPYRAASVLQLAMEITAPTLFCGDGWLLYQEAFRKKLGDRAMEAGAPYHTIRASFVAEAARQRLFAARGDDPLTSTPVYVRPSEAELNNPHL